MGLNLIRISKARKSNLLKVVKTDTNKLFMGVLL